MSATKAAASAKPAGLRIFGGRFAVLPVLKRKLQILVKKISRSEGKNLKANLIFISDAKMRNLNRNFRKKDKTTDVLSFSLETNGKAIQGEIYISWPQAGRQAPRFGNRLEGEILRLTAHGCLHLIGYDHHTIKEKKKMFAREEKYLTGFGASSSRGSRC